MGSAGWCDRYGRSVAFHGRHARCAVSSGLRREHHSIASVAATYCSSYRNVSTIFTGADSHPFSLLSLRHQLAKHGQERVLRRHVAADGQIGCRDRRIWVRHGFLVPQQPVLRMADSTSDSRQNCSDLFGNGTRKWRFCGGVRRASATRALFGHGIACAADCSKRKYARSLRVRCRRD